MKNIGETKPLILRDYQEDGLTLMRESVRKGNKHVIYWLATGGGKSPVTCELIRRLVAAKKTVLFVVRRRELILQFSKTVQKFVGIAPSVIMGQETKFDPDCPVQVCSIDTISRRIELPQYSDLLKIEHLIIDEAHDSTADNYQIFLNKFPNAFWYGFTATPFPTGKKYLGNHGWQDVVCPITPAQLRDQGWLVKDRIYAPKKIDTSGIKMTAGDFDNRALSIRASESQIVGDIVDTWKKYGEDRPTILFAVNKDHSSLMCQAFKNAGIPATHQDESHDSEERAYAIGQLKSGAIKILCNVNIFSTGVDIPIASCCIMARPTKSLILFLQQIGRVLRPYKICLQCQAEIGGEKLCRCGSSDFSFVKHDTIILDHANNCENHGLPYEYREAEINKDVRTRDFSIKEIRTKTCGDCYAVHAGHLLSCPHCGSEAEKKEREIIHLDGELALISEKSFELDKYKSFLEDLLKKELRHNWKPSAKYLMLHQQFGGKIFNFKTELGLPGWLKGKVAQNSINKLLSES